MCSIGKKAYSVGVVQSLTGSIAKVYVILEYSELYLAIVVHIFVDNAFEIKVFLGLLEHFFLRLICSAIFRVSVHQVTCDVQMQKGLVYVRNGLEFAFL
jgi:hypothetical protein